MIWSEARNTWFYAWMKIILPLLALTLLSGLFTISKKFDHTQDSTAITHEVKTRSQEQGVKNSVLSGMTNSGNLITVKADSAVPDENNPNLINAKGITAEIKLTSEIDVILTAANAQVDMENLAARLSGKPHMVTSNGYQATTEEITIKINPLHAETKGEISGEGPIGLIAAGKMTLTEDEEGGGAKLLFIDGVNLVYHKRKLQEQE
ncbi:MAG: hypothetical protein OXD29_04525 [Roseovarius sp.]|nr:hypothetical protein [Roseovarius sp.]